MIKCLQIVGDSKYGGATFLILSWCQFLLDKGCDVTVLSTDEITISRLREIPGVSIINSVFIPRDVIPLQDVKAIGQLFRLLERSRFDVVHTYTAIPGFLGRIAARLARIPVIVHHQAGWPVTEFSSLFERLVYTPLEYLAVLASTRSICVSHAVAQQSRQFRIAPQSKLVTICNGIEPQPFIMATESGVGQALRQELGIPADHLLIGNTGRLAQQKDNETLIRAMVPLKSALKERPFTLLLAGDGPDQQKLQDLVQSLNLSENVRLLGFRTDIPAFLNTLDVFVSPSLWEGLSISLLEAMAAARPIVTTSIPPNAELIEHEVTGLLVPPKSPEQIAQAIVRFVQEPDLAQRCATAARQRVLECYTIDRMFQETWNLYVSLLRERQLETVIA